MKKFSLLIIFIHFQMFSQTFENRLNIHPHQWCSPKVIDFDNDGLQDLVSASFGGEIAWWKNTGTGFEKNLIDYNYIKSWSNIDVIDIDNDGDLDILISEKYTLALYYNDGNGNFTSYFIESLLSRYTNIIGGDFDNDGLVDFITTSRSSNGKVIFWKNTGNTTQYYYGFNPIDIKNESIEKGDIQVIDMDNDGDLDLIYSLRFGFNGNSIVCLLNDGGGNFINHPINYNVSSKGIQVLDYDNDGDKDFAVIQSNYHIQLFINQGNLNFVRQELFDAHNINSELGAIRIIDSDNDGDKDIAITNTYSFSTNYFGILENTGSNYVLNTINNIPKGFFINSFDFNNDSYIDFIVTTDNSDTPLIFEKSNNTYNKFVLDDFYMLPDKFISTDFDNDGKIDILSISENEMELVLWHNLGNYNFDKIVIDNDLPQSFFVHIDAADFSNNGYNDILLSTSQSFNTGKMILYTNTGNLSFNKSILFNTPAQTSFFTDIDFDGDLDIIYSLYAGNGKIKCKKNEGNGNFQTIMLVNHIDYTHCIAYKDADNDGLRDIITDKYSIYKNIGNFNYTEIQLPVRNGFWVDTDNDGDLDIIGGTPLNNSQTLSWWENDGNFNFIEHQIQTNIITDDITANDFDGDGDIDFICSSGMNYYRLTFWVNDGNMQFSPNVIDNQKYYNVWHALSNDFDGDGDIDLLSSSTRFPLALWDNLSNNTIEYSISTNVNPNNGGTVTGAGNYTYGQTVNLSAIPQNDYVFINWTENGHPVSGNQNYTFVATSNRTIIANFYYNSDIEAWNNKKFKIYPNPTQDILYIKNSENQKVTKVNIYNLQG